MKNMKKIVLLASFSLLLFSCNKGPGTGGIATITGKVNVEDYDQSFSTLWAEYDGADRDVYIQYGENETYNDKVKTGPTGIFKFTGLLKGDYTIYTYSKDSSLQSPSGEISYSVDVTITEKKEVFTVPDFTVFE
jgi:hypothetical protein